MHRAEWLDQILASDVVKHCLSIPNIQYIRKRELQVQVLYQVRVFPREWPLCCLPLDRLRNAVVKLTSHPQGVRV